MNHDKNKAQIAKSLGIREDFIEEQCESYIIQDITNKTIKLGDELLQIEINKPIQFHNCTIAFDDELSPKTTNLNLEFYKCNFTNTRILCKFNNKVVFKKCEFELSSDRLKIFDEIYFSCQFLSDVNFSDSTFKNNVNFSSIIFEGNADFHKCVFEKTAKFYGVKLNKVSNFSNTHFIDNAIFNNSVFNGNTDFRECEFEKTAKFYGATFEKVSNFSNTHFIENAYFNNSTFKDSADFRECEFEKTACFYGVKFDKVPNFSQAQFKGSLNAVNANLNFDFENLENKIEQEHIKHNKKENANKPLAHFANDFRDSFRIFKNALIKDNNLLDASNFHKYELYSKEIELKESRHKRGINTNNNEDARKNIKPFKELIDFLLLRFYRNLCDHHTDFLKCFNNLVLLVALYAVLLWIGNFDLMQGKEPIISDILHQLGDKAITLKKDIKKYDWLVFLIFLALAVSCLYYLYKTIYLEHKLYIKNIKLILSFTKNSLKNICFFMLISVAIIFFYAAIIATLITLLNLNDMHYWQSYLNFISFVLFFVIYFSLISLDCVFVRFLLVIAAYIITSISIGKNIAILNPLIGKLLNTSIEIKDPIFQSITIAYTISTLLVLFSLQKTARKNSIVPS